MGRENTNKSTFISQRPNQTAVAAIHYLVKATGDHVMGNCIFAAIYFRHFFAYRLDKEGLGSQDKQDWLCKNTP